MEHFRIILTLLQFLKKDISFNCIRDMVLRGFELEPFKRHHGEKIMEIVGKMKLKNPDFIHPVKFNALKNILLTEGRYNWEAMIELRNPSFFPEHSMIYYKEFDSSILNSFRIEVTDSLHKGHDIVRSFPRTYKAFIYVDTENSYTTLPHGTDLALLTFCDIATRTVLLWRVHKMSAHQMRQIQGVIRGISEMRQFACFGAEPFFESPQDVQYQRNDGTLISLKEAVKESVGLDIDKRETMSDWTKEILTKDQIVYAAMDALAVHYIWSGRRIRLG
ncbi:hypothetical protein CRE_19499 [Caenorhabditis remanei]|uniref:3'-5' exonuclease domain-containing protein n=1 Tax=Caenorhabditis remanei TaxID=31234 RepID=E3NG71_CAERE|nr:hypothetical protein CRE_19499 [Caenorhabditis remanei]